ncbi:MAG: NTP transferase domain-containing protein, partial [bacterium]|nr:NTP transferase domain-containing protein [bacterium]
MMAGGEGTRLRPLTSTRPKPLAPVANKPVMHHIVDLLRTHGLTSVVATVHYLADEIESYFGDGSAYGVEMLYVVEDTPLGTAGAVKLGEEQLAGEPFVVISGDALTDLDLTAVIEQHKRWGSKATIVLQRVENPLEFGVVITDESGRITRFLEKPTWSEVFSDTINTGIYVLEPEVLGYMESGRSYDFSKDIFPHMLADGVPMYGYVTGDYWTDIGNLQQYRQANYDALAGKVRLQIPGTQIRPGIWVDEGTEIDPTANLHGPLAIGRNCTIGPGALIEEFTSVGDATIVEEQGQLHRAVIWDNVYLGKGAKLTACTLCDRNIVKEYVSVQEGVVVGRGCSINAGATISPQVKIWPDKAIAAGAMVSMSLIWGIKWPGSLFGGDGVRGLANIEITPEFATKLGQAFGSFLRPGQTVMTSRDTHHASRVVNRCIISGLLAVGLNVSDLRSYPIPLSRYAARQSGDGGVHVRVSPDDPNSFLIEFFAPSGINVDKNVERKIENLFFREDFRRTSMDDVGLLDFPGRALERYASGFIQSLASTALPEARFKVVVDFAYGSAAAILPRLLGQLGIEMVSLNAYFDDTKVRTFADERPRYIQQLSTIVRTLEANAGVLVDPGGEQLTVVDDRGRAIHANELLALAVLLVVRAKSRARVAVPVSAPSVIERIAREHGAEVIRTKSDRRTMMELAQAEGERLDFVGGARVGVIFPEFQAGFDAIFGTAKLLELLA